MQQAAVCLSDLDQLPLKSVVESMQSFLNAIAKPELLKHQDPEVKLFVAACICEITRITAPEAPYDDDVLKVHFPSEVYKVSNGAHRLICNCFTTMTFFICVLVNCFMFFSRISFN